MGLDELLERYFASDDEAAMAELVRQTRGKLLAVARRISRDDAEDAVQATYLSLAKKGGLGGAPVLPWLLTAVARIAYRARATHAREHAIAERLAPSAAPPEPPEIAIGDEEAELLRRELWKLPAGYRDALQLRYLHGLSGVETARLLGVNDSTLRTRLQRGRRMLRSRLGRVLFVIPWLFGDASAALVLGGTMKAKLALVLLLVAVLIAYTVSARRHAGPARALPEEAARVPSPDAGGTAGPADLTRGEQPGDVRQLPEPVSDEERSRYLEWRRVSEIFASTRRLHREVGALIEETTGDRRGVSPARSDTITADYIKGLIREYRSLAPGAGRQELLGRIVDTHREYLDATRDPAFLAFFEDVARDSLVQSERTLAVPDGNGSTVDLLLRLRDHPDPEVRAAVVISLAQADDPRAAAAVALGLEDPASSVRWTAAVEIEYSLTDPGRVPALLARVARETHPLAADAIVRAIEALDPEGGASRVEQVIARAPAPVREVVRVARESPAIETGVRAAEGAGPVDGERRPDEGTRAYLENLLREHRSLQPGQERLAVLERLGNAHAEYLKGTGDASLLPFLAEIARTSPVEDERVAVVRSFSRTDDPRVVDLLFELKASAEEIMRREAATGLAWVQGTEADRARKALLDLLADPAPSVRRTVAILAPSAAGDAAMPLLLTALRRETDLTAAYAMITAVRRLDPEGGAARIESARFETSASIRAVIDAALQLRAR